MAGMSSLTWTPVFVRKTQLASFYFLLRQLSVTKIRDAVGRCGFNASVTNEIPIYSALRLKSKLSFSWKKADVFHTFTKKFRDLLRLELFAGWPVTGRCQ